MPLITPRHQRQPGEGMPYMLAALSFLVHNLEEANGLPFWAAMRGIRLDPQGFIGALAGLSVLVIMLLMMARVMRRAQRVQFVAAMVAGALILNGVGHVVFSVWVGEVMPGFVTGIMLMVPTSAFLLWAIPLSGRAKWIAGLLGAALMPAVAYAALVLSGTLI